MNDADHRINPEEVVADAIDAAEEVQYPLDDLIERTRTDPGAPFRIVDLSAAAGIPSKEKESGLGDGECP